MNERTYNFLTVIYFFRQQRFTHFLKKAFVCCFQQANENLKIVQTHLAYSKLQDIATIYVLYLCSFDEILMKF